MKTRTLEASPLRDRTRELRSDLARKIAACMGPVEDRATDISGRTIFLYGGPSASNGGKST